VSASEHQGRFPYVEPSSLRRAAVVCHRNADADAYLSAFALSKLIGSLAPQCAVDIACPDGMTTLTAKLRGSFPHDVVDESAEEYDLYVAVDVGDVELLKGWAPKMRASKGMKVLVDHHPLRDAGLYDRTIVDESATSAAEVVFRLFETCGVPLDGEAAQALMLALLFDSSHLAIAGSSGLRTAVKLMDAGADVDAARKELRTDPDYGEVLAKLKGAQRLKIFKLGQWVAASTEVGSYQAHVARALIAIGADVAVVGGTTDDETRVSLRCNYRFHDRTKVELGTDVAAPVGTSLGGHGGGHATAASFTASCDEEKAIQAALAKIGEMAGGQPQAV
jgi:nanoRNase/pAp phosphatase (c-di-AMP/oligoRNAs hydrolase)